MPTPSRRTTPVLALAAGMLAALMGCAPPPPPRTPAQPPPAPPPAAAPPASEAPPRRPDPPPPARGPAPVASPPPAPSPEPPAPATPEAPKLTPVFDATLWRDKPGPTLAGTHPVFITDRAWRADESRPDGPHDLEKWKTYLRGLPHGALVIVDEEFLHDDPRGRTREWVLPRLAPRVALHRTLRETRPDLVNADVCGPCPTMETAAVVWNDQPLLRRWREGNDITMPVMREHLRALAIELYFCPRAEKPVRGSYLEDYTAIHEANVAEARRHAQGRPVLGVLWLRTKGEGKKNWGRYVGDEIARYMLEETARTCDGVVLWDAQFEDDGTWKGAQRYNLRDPALALTLRWLQERTR